MSEFNAHDPESVVKALDRNCPHCEHSPHGGRVCGGLKSETVHDTVGLFGPCSGESFTFATGICKCGQEPRYP